MSDFPELMVRFRRGVPEDQARRIAQFAGAAIVRKMRTDRPDEVMLLVRVGDVAKIDAKLKESKDVISTEVNQTDIKALPVEEPPVAKKKTAKKKS